MTKGAIVKAINAAFSEIRYAAKEDHVTRDILDRAIKEATENQKQHERGRYNGTGVYPFSRTTYVRFDIVRWFCLHQAKPVSLAYAASIRPDIFLIGALRELLDEKGKTPWLTNFEDTSKNTMVPPLCASWDFPNLALNPVA